MSTFQRCNGESSYVQVFDSHDSQFNIHSLKFTNSFFAAGSFPKDENLAQKWKLAIGIDDNKFFKAFVCSAHFFEGDFRRKDQSQLKKGSVPTIFKMIERIEPIEQIEQIEQIENVEYEQCISCCKKDALIEKYEEQIEKLKKELKSARNKAFYLESVKNNLSTTLTQMKTNKLIDEKLNTSLQVTVAITHDFYIFLIVGSTLNIRIF